MGKERNIKKVSIIISKNGLEDVLAGLIMAHGARMEGIEVMIFFTFFGLDVILQHKVNKLKLSKEEGITTEAFLKAMEKFDIPPVKEFVEMVYDFGAKLYACKATADMWGIKKEDLLPEVEDIISVGQFYTLSDDAQHIIFI